jgi:hypothetical protein
LEHAPRHRDHAPILAGLDPELDGLPLGIPAGVLGGTAVPPLTGGGRRTCDRGRESEYIDFFGTQ